MIVPDPVDDAAPCEGVGWVGDPVGEGGAACGFVFGVLEGESCGEVGDGGECAWGDFLAGFVEIAAFEDADGAGFVEGDETAVIAGGFGGGPDGDWGRESG